MLVHRVHGAAEAELTEREAGLADDHAARVHPAGGLLVATADGGDVVRRDPVRLLVVAREEREERVDRGLTDLRERLRADVVHAHVGAIRREEEERLDHVRDGGRIAEVAHLLARHAVDEEALILVDARGDLREDRRRRVVVQRAERADEVDPHPVVDAAVALHAVERLAQRGDRLVLLGLVQLHALDGLSRRDGVVLTDLGAPVQRGDERRHGAHVLHLEEQVQDALPVRRVGRVAGVGRRERLDRDVRDAHRPERGPAVAVLRQVLDAAVTVGRGERRGVEPVQVRDRVLATHGIRELLGLTRRVVRLRATSDHDAHRDSDGGEHGGDLVPFHGFT